MPRKRSAFFFELQSSVPHVVCRMSLESAERGALSSTGAGSDRLSSLVLISLAPSPLAAAAAAAAAASAATATATATTATTAAAAAVNFLVASP